MGQELSARPVRAIIELLVKRTMQPKKKDKVVEERRHDVRVQNTYMKTSFLCYRFSFSVSSGTISKRLPTRPTSATWNIGASASLLIAAITLLSFMPARCWIAPEMPAQRYSSGATFLPVCPTCKLLSAKPLSTAALDAPIAAPKASASGGMILSNSSFDFNPRPPDMTLLAVARSGRSDFAKSSESHSVLISTLGSTPSTISAEPPPTSAAAKAVPLIVIILILSDD